MLAEYLQGTVPQLVERARLLKGKIPRGLPRDYEALIKTCHDELDNTHPLLAHKDHPVLDRLSQRFLEVTTQLHDYFAERRVTESRRRGPQSFKDEIDIWEILWTKWLVEFFCDLFAVFTLGPAFVWSHFHLFMKMGKDPYEMSTAFRPATHPADDARMRTLLAALRSSGFYDDAVQIEARWKDALLLANAIPSPNYPFCYPNELIQFMVTKAQQGVAEMRCRMAAPNTTDQIHVLLNEAWRKFWNDPASYHQWEMAAVAQLSTLCRSDQPTPPVAMAKGVV
jgi:hypothetical protein